MKKEAKLTAGARQGKQKTVATIKPSASRAVQTDAAQQQPEPLPGVHKGTLRLDSLVSKAFESLQELAEECREAGAALTEAAHRLDAIDRPALPDGLAFLRVALPRPVLNGRVRLPALLRAQLDLLIADWTLREHAVQTTGDVSYRKPGQKRTAGVRKVLQAKHGELAEPSAFVELAVALGKDLESLRGVSLPTLSEDLR